MKTNNMHPEEFLFMLVSVLTFIFGVICGNMSGKEEIRKEAARNGAAYYVTDKDGNSAFVWNTK
jgi:hypothetical protein